MRIALYKAFPSGKLYQKAIAWFTRPGPYSHAELVFDEWDGRFCAGMDIRQHDAGGSLCFSSAENDGGTRFKILDINARQWDWVNVALGYKRAMAWCVAHQNVNYDWAGLRGFVFPWCKPDPKDLFCSECAAECLQDQQLFLDLIPGKTSPNALAKALGLIV